VRTQVTASKCKLPTVCVKKTAERGKGGDKNKNGAKAPFDAPLIATLAATKWQLELVNQAYCYGIT